MANFCTNYRKEIDEDARFSLNCGIKQPDKVNLTTDNNLLKDPVQKQSKDKIVNQLFFSRLKVKNNQQKPVNISILLL